jgi:hypothetical protein
MGKLQKPKAIRAGEKLVEENKNLPFPGLRTSKSHNFPQILKGYLQHGKGKLVQGRQSIVGIFSSFLASYVFPIFSHFLGCFFHSHILGFLPQERV